MCATTDTTSTPINNPVQQHHSNPALNAVLQDLHKNGSPHYCDLPKCTDCGVCIYPGEEENTLGHKTNCHCVEKCKHCGVCMDYVSREWSYHRDTCPLDPKCDGCGESVRHSHGKESTMHHSKECYRVPKCLECGNRMDRYTHNKSCSQFCELSIA